MLISFSAAIKRYFTSQKEAANRQRKNKTESHKKRQATYERKKEVKIKLNCYGVWKKYVLILLWDVCLIAIEFNLFCFILES